MYAGLLGRPGKKSHLPSLGKDPVHRPDLPSLAFMIGMHSASDGQRCG
jgi:hypothetical protein